MTCDHRDGRIYQARLTLTIVIVTALVSGCSIGLRGSVAPTLDTNGHLGAQVIIGGTVGGTRKHALTFTSEAVGSLAQGQGFTGIVSLGGDVVASTSRPWRVGLRAGVGTSSGDAVDFLALSFVTAVFPNATHTDGGYRRFGVEARVTWLAGREWEDVVRFSFGPACDFATIFDTKVIP